MEWSLAPGATLSLEQAWRLAHAWFEADRGAPEWQRPPLERVEALFASLADIEGFFADHRLVVSGAFAS